MKNSSGLSIHVNHIGFRPDDPMKRAVMPVPAGHIGWLGGDVFNVVEMSTLIRFGLGTPEWLAAQHPHFTRLEHTPLGDFVACEFSDVTARAGYQVHGAAARSYPFLVYRDAWKRCFRLLLEWYRIAACGEAVPGYHEVCHLDDCRMADTGEQKDLVGGWHDAGDLRKWSSTMSFVTTALTRLVEEQPDLAAVGVDADLVAHQLDRAAAYLLKMIDPQTGLVWHSIASDLEGNNESGVWTDNVPASGDERGAKRDTFPSTCAHHVQALAGLARVYAKSQPERSRRLVAAAVRVLEALRTRLDRENAPEDLVDCALALWRATGEAAWRDLATQGLRDRLARQVTEARFGQDMVRGYLVRNGTLDGNHGFRGRGGRNLFHFAQVTRQLANALLCWPAHPDAARWRDGLTLLLEGCLEPMIRLSPYRALPACLCLETDAAPGARPLAGQLRFRYFGAHAEGNNGELAQAAEAFGLAARALRAPRWAAWGQKQLEWVYGFNPAECCMMTGLGYSTAAVFSPYVGQIPGAIVNGFLGTAEGDEPRLCLDRQMSPMIMEYWSVHTGAVLAALAVLENEPLA